MSGTLFNLEKNNLKKKTAFSVCFPFSWEVQTKHEIDVFPICLFVWFAIVADTEPSLGLILKAPLQNRSRILQITAFVLTWASRTKQNAGTMPVSVANNIK